MKKIILSAFLILVTQMMLGQVETRFFSQKNAFDKVEEIKNNSKAQKLQKLPTFNREKMLEEDEMNDGKDVPFRFGKGFDVNLSLSDGAWIEVENGRLWSLEFESQGAFSINFVFNDFYLPEGAYLYIGNTQGTMLYGPVTSKENPKDGYFLTDLIIGDKVTIYLFEPKDKLRLSTLTIKRVVHAYRNMFVNKYYGNYGASGSCNNDVVCFSEWSTESDAVALVLLSNGTEWCSGSLLMSANYSFIPYFLTAFHCIDTSENGVLSETEITEAQRWLFKFQYKKSSCSGNSATTGITYNSGTFRAAWNDTDFALIEMNTSPIGDSRFSWLGWNRIGDVPTSSTGIHHPSGDVMKISFDNNSLLETDYGGNTGTSHWRVEWNNGITEGGSSGSPLFDQNKRVVGQLHGGYSSCSSIDKRDWYGCFHHSWTGGGTNATRLSNWLDPTNTGVMTINTSRYPTISGPSTICAGNTVTFTVDQSIPNYTWHSSSNLALKSTSGNSANFSVNYIGNQGWVSIKIGEVEVARKNIIIGSEIVGSSIISSAGTTIYDAEPKCSGSMNNRWILTWSNLDYNIELPDTVHGKNNVKVAAYSAPGNMATYFLRLIQANGNEYVKYIEVTDVKLGLLGIKPIDPFPPLIPLLTPNPASGYVIVSMEEMQNHSVSGKSNAPAPYTIQLWNSFGLVRSVQTDLEAYQLDLHGIPAGFYYVHVIKEGQTYRKQLIVK